MSPPFRIYDKGIPAIDLFRIALKRSNLTKLRRALEMDRSLANQEVDIPGYGKVLPLLYLAGHLRSLELVQELLVNHQADVNIKNSFGRTALHSAVISDNLKMAKLLLEHGAKVDAKENYGSTPLNHARSAEMVHLLVSRDSSGGFSPSLAAVEKSDLEKFMNLVEHGADIQITDANGWACIHLAAARNSPEIMQYLLEHGADVHARTTDGSTPLHCCHQNLEVARLLLQHGADVDARDLDGDTPFIKASYLDNIEMAQLLIDYGADITMDGEKALGAAAECKKLDMVRFLLQLGVDPNAINVFGRTPLHATVRSRNFRDNGQIILSLIGFGADINAKERDTGLTALHRACEHYDISKVELLLQNGADVHARDNEGWTPLLWACAYGRWEIVKKLVIHGANVNDRAHVDSTCMEGTEKFNSSCSQTPLMIAFMKGEEEIVHLFIEHGADMNVREKNTGLTILHRAGERGDGALVDLLLRKDADIHVRDKEGWTPLLWASAFGQWEIVKKLVDHGAQVNDCAYMDSTGLETYKWYTGKVHPNARTPLSMACWCHREEEAVKYLLDAGACVEEYRDLDGSTPLLNAAEKGSCECAVLLLQRGADIHAQQSQLHKDRTPFFVACQKGCLDVIYCMIRFSPHHHRPQPHCVA